MTTPNVYEQKRTWLEELKSLSTDEYTEIFRIIRRHEVEYSENTNGIFFDLTQVSESCFTDLVKFMDLCKARRVNEETRNKELNTLREESDILTNST